MAPTRAGGTVPDRRMSIPALTVHCFIKRMVLPPVTFLAMRLVPPGTRTGMEKLILSLVPAPLTREEGVTPVPLTSIPVQTARCFTRKMEQLPATFWAIQLRGAETPMATAGPIFSLAPGAPT